MNGTNVLVHNNVCMCTAQMCRHHKPIVLHDKKMWKQMCKEDFLTKLFALSKVSLDELTVIHKEEFYWLVNHFTQIGLEVAKNS